MEEERKQKVALFRYGIISRLKGQKDVHRGQKEKEIKEIMSQPWEIPYSNRTYIGRSTLQDWVKRYDDSGGRIESLYPSERSDIGKARSMDMEVEAALVNLKRELKGVSLPVMLKIAKERKILPVDFRASRQSIYRMLNRHELGDDTAVREDMRKFEVEFPNNLWQSDCMHGPWVIVDSKQMKSFLFVFIDDHSRIIPHAEFYLRENIDNFIDCFQKALKKRGIPQKLYVDNGPSFRSHQLSFATASLGITLIHCTAYRPQGKGKIERLIKTIRMQFLPLIPKVITLEKLNERLWQWIDKEYHLNTHSSIKSAPLNRYIKHLQRIKQAPENLIEYFRKRIIRKVDRDRTVSLMGKVYEAPVELTEKNVSLLYHESELDKIEVFYNNTSYGFLVPLNTHINSRVKRKHFTDIVSEHIPETHSENTNYCGGKLFNREENDDKL